MVKLEKDFSLNQKVSSQLAFALLLVLGFAVALYTVNAGQEIVESAKVSDTFNFDKRAKKAIAPAKPLILNKN
jgi:hypothetical protein